MNSVILSKTYEAPALCKKEILRYAGCQEADGGITALLESCAEEAGDKLTYKVCYRELPVTVMFVTLRYSVYGRHTWLAISKTVSV